MVRRLVPLSHSLGMRLFLPLVLVVSTALTIHAALSYKSTEEHFLEFVRADVMRCNELVKRAMHDGMLLNEKEGLQTTISRLAESPGVSALRVYDKSGVIALSGHVDELHTRIDLSSETCRSCHEDHVVRDDALLESHGLTRAERGNQVLRHLSVIENEPSCSTAACHAHDASQRVLGVLDVEMSMVPLEETLATAERQMIWTTLSLLAVLALLAWWFVARLVNRPVRVLREGTRRVARGALDTRIEVHGAAELVELAQAFNQMAADLESARREITSWSQKLEEKILSRTEELQHVQSQVLHMERMASLGKLAATVAHELNNPLTGVLTYSKLVERELALGPPDEAGRKELGRYLALIQRECTRCGEIVKNLLLFARRRGAEMAPIDLDETVERSLMLVRHLLDLQGVRVRYIPLEGDRVIVADGSQLQQALIALFVNAAEAMGGMKTGAAELCVRLEARADDVVVHVEDTGVGMSPEIQQHIFEPFFSTKHEQSGVGLGLAVVYGIVRRHGGRIDVESVPNHGTTFRLTLPRRPPTTPVDPLQDTERWIRERGASRQASIEETAS